MNNIEGKVYTEWSQELIDKLDFRLSSRVPDSMREDVETVVKKNLTKYFNEGKAVNTIYILYMIKSKLSDRIRKLTGLRPEVFELKQKQVVSWVKLRDLFGGNCSESIEWVKSFLVQDDSMKILFSELDACCPKNMRKVYGSG